jgi:hypothetical protein
MPDSIGLTDLKCLLAEDAQLIEVLGPREYANEHLPGAINIPLRRLASETTAQLDDRKPIAVYCHGLAQREYPRLSAGRQAAVPRAGQVHPGCRDRGMIPA